MRAAEMRFVWDYYYWATWRLLAAAEGLSDEEFTAPRPGGHSLQHLFVHTMSAERGWRTGFQTGERPPRLALEDFPNLASVVERWRAEEALTKEFVASLDDAGLDRPFIEGLPLWQFLLHVANHGTQHRSEAALILTELGRSPGDLDLSFFMLPRSR